MRYLTRIQTLDLYRQLMLQSGGATGIRDLNALESAIAQPRATYAGKELYPTLGIKQQS